MRLKCRVLVGSHAVHNVGSCRRYKSVLLILRNGKLRKAGRCELVITTPQDRKGRVFNITRENVRRIHLAKEDRGRATIEMNNPSVLICITEASPALLSRFIGQLRDVLDGKELVAGEDGKNAFAEIPERQVINSLEQYVSKKPIYHSNLRELVLSNIGFDSVDSRWFQATSLQLLDLSHNKLGGSETFNIKFLNIVRLRNLKLLILASNEIKSISDELWDAFPKGLRLLDLSCNEISYLSPCCTQFPQLTDLLISNNKIERLPYNMSNLSSLRFLDISWNQIKFLPAEIVSLKLDKIDVAACSGKDPRRIEDTLRELRQAVEQPVKVGSLFEYAAATVLNNRISMDFLPKFLREIVHKAAVKCSRKYSGNYKFYPASMINVKYVIENARSLAVTTTSLGYEPVILQYMELI